MKTIVSVAAMVALFVGVALSATGPMPSMPDREPDGARPICFGRAIVMGYDTPETRDENFYAFKFWSLMDESRRPFLAAHFSSQLEFEAWVDFNRDGKADQYYPDAASYFEAHPEDNLCAEVLPRVS